MKNIISAGVISLLLSGCSVFGANVYEEPSFQIVATEGKVEIREYPSILVAQTTVEGSEDEMRNTAFRRLFRYITGNNAGEKSIEMTTPVMEQSASSQGKSIEMTAPVMVQDEPVEGEIRKWEMSFVMPKEYSLDNVPKPKDPTVRIKELPARTVAVLTFSGSLDQSNVDENQAILERWIENSKYRATSRPRTAGYNPPWTLPFLRRNEIHVDVE